MMNAMYLAPAQGYRLKKRTAPMRSSIGPKDVQIRLKAVAINPADIKMIDEGHRVLEWPIVPGLDGAGIVEAVGAEVERVAVGEEVLAQFTPGPSHAGGGSFQMSGVVNEMMVARKPKNLIWEEAASIPVCYFTAMVGLGIGLSLPLPFLQNNFAMDAVRFRSVLVLGGSSALGASAIQLLHLALPQCQILVTASPKHHMHITEVLGAQMVFDRNSPSLIVDIRDATSNSNGVDAILDTVGAGASERHIFDTFRPDGPRRYAQVWTGDNEIEVPVGVESVLFRSRDFQQMPGGENMFLALETLLREEKYKAPLATRMIGSGLEYLEAGLDEMRKGVSGEKLIVLA